MKHKSHRAFFGLGALASVFAGAALPSGLRNVDLPAKSTAVLMLR